MRQSIIEDINYSQASLKKQKLKDKPHFVITPDRKTNTLFKVNRCYLNDNKELMTDKIRYLEIDMNVKKIFVVDEFLERRNEDLTQYIFNKLARELITKWKKLLDVSSKPFSGPSIQLSSEYERVGDPTTYFLRVEIFSNGAMRYYHQELENNSTIRVGTVPTLIAQDGDSDRLITYIDEIANGLAPLSTDFHPLTRLIDETPKAPRNSPKPF